MVTVQTPSALLLIGNGLLSNAPPTATVLASGAFSVKNARPSGKTLGACAPSTFVEAGLESLSIWPAKFTDTTIMTARKVVCFMWYAFSFHGISSKAVTEVIAARRTVRLARSKLKLSHRPLVFQRQIRPLPQISRRPCRGRFVGARRRQPGVAFPTP